MIASERVAMSTLDRLETKTLPPLVAGERLDRATFHERYKAMPPHVRAELVGGVVYMPSPLGYEHGESDRTLSYWLGHYQRFTKGVGGANNATTQFDDYGEPQPDLQLRILEELGGESRIAGGFVVGAPELIIEIAKSSQPYDLVHKKNDYERAGVLEYVIVAIDPHEVFWFARRDGRFVAHSAGPDGVFRSEVFPGLWLDPAAFFADDVERLIATLERGLATPEHAAFVARLTEQGQG
jgi:Uma2 family endonuclease